MTQEQEAEVQRLIKDVDVTELMGMLMKHGNRYSRRILKFFRWYCKYMPLSLMSFTLMVSGTFLSIPKKCLFLTKKICHVISSFILWFIFFRW